MKKILYLLCTLCCFVGLFSCDGDLMDNLFPESVHKVLYIRDSGVQPLESYAVQEKFQKDIVVIKAGSDKNTSANLDVKLMSQAEIAKAYPQSAKLNYTVVPANCYTIPESLNVTLGTDQQTKSLPVIFDVRKLKTVIESNPSLTYVFGAELTGEDLSCVNADKSSVLYVLSMVIQSVEWDIPQIIEKELTSESPATTTVELKAKVTNNTENFDCLIDFNGAQAIVDKYNTDNSTTYKLLPADAYTIGFFKFSSGKDNSKATLSLDKSKLATGTEYLLPMKFAALTNGNNVSKDVHYLDVAVTSEYTGSELNKSTWKILLCNSDHVMQQQWGERSAAALIDGDVKTCWHSQHTGWIAAEFEQENKQKGDDYSYDNLDNRGQAVGYKYAFKGLRHNAIIVIDMQEVKTIQAIGLYQRAELQYARFKSAKIYISNDSEFKFTPGNISDYNVIEENNWNLVCDWKDIPNTTANLQWKDISGKLIGKNKSKGRFIKIYTDECYYDYIYGDYMHTNLAEIMFKEVSTIDGKPIN